MTDKTGLPEKVETIDPSDKIEKEEQATEEKDNTTTNLKGEITEITEPMIETLIGEETMAITKDHRGDNNKDINLKEKTQEEKNSEKEHPFNGLKLTKSVQGIKNSTSLSR